MVLKLPTPVPATGLSCTMANVEAQVYARKLTDWKRLEAYTPANTTAAANSTAAPILILCKCFFSQPAGAVGIQRGAKRRRRGKAQPRAFAFGKEQIHRRHPQQHQQAFFVSCAKIQPAQ